jgi:hypothetical protein
MVDLAVKCPKLVIRAKTLFGIKLKRGGTYKKRRYYDNIKLLKKLLPKVTNKKIDGNMRLLVLLIKVLAFNF